MIYFLAWNGKELVRYQAAFDPPQYLNVISVNNHKYYKPDGTIKEKYLEVPLLDDKHSPNKNDKMSEIINPLVHFIDETTELIDLPYLENVVYHIDKILNSSDYSDVKSIQKYTDIKDFLQSIINVYKKRSIQVENYRNLMGVDDSDFDNIIKNLF